MTVLCRGVDGRLASPVSLVHDLRPRLCPQQTAARVYTAVSEYGIESCRRKILSKIDTSIILCILKVQLLSSLSQIFNEC